MLLRWLEAQTDFTTHGELPDAQRRIMESLMHSMVSNWADIVRLASDFCVMLVRSSAAGESSLSFYVRGVLERMWMY